MVDRRYFEKMYKIFVCSIITWFLVAGNVFSQPFYSLSEETGLYKKVVDIRLVTEDREIFLSELYDQSPLVLALIFTRCTGICNPFLMRLIENVHLLNPRQNFKVLVVSFDPRDAIGDMEKQAKVYGLDDDDRWIFAVTDQIEELTTAVDFFPEWDERTGQFDHEALVVGINENGYILRKQAGLREAKAFSSLLAELDHEFILSYPLPGQNHLFSCFTYNPVTGQKSPSYGWLILVAPVMIVFIILVFSTCNFRKLIFFDL